ncbi:uncharacterized protein PAC_01127 [Phialocephala subalpina]|uniref:NACHT domain-containing protein n=1 Tax=Phialocephala subalpina TaxID=576137 RepID=A0A1L7WEP6_9HELO|nr:uncharacterized protein PAC_01127 [Phialocephala subalpina]
MTDSRPTTPARPGDNDYNGPASEHLLAQFNGNPAITLLQAPSPVGSFPVPDSRATTPSPPAGNAYSRPISPNCWEFIQTPSPVLPPAYSRPMSPNRWEFIQAPSPVLPPLPSSRTNTPGPPAGHTFENPISQGGSSQHNGNRISNIESPSIHQHQQVVVMTPIANDLQHQNPQSQGIQESIEGLQSLHFKEMTSRKCLITKNCEGTCGWLLGHGKYRTWKMPGAIRCGQQQRNDVRHVTDEASDILWITGMPGSGKSTLLKYAAQETEKSSPACIVASFFFSRSGTQMQRSALGLFRSLLHQLFTPSLQLPDFFLQTFRAKRNTKGKSGEDWEWHKEELQNFFNLYVASSRYRILIFIDALDECTEDDPWQLVHYFKTLAASADSTLSICFSCRHIPSIGPSDDDAHTICVEKENEKDISTYITANLKPAFKEEAEEQHIKDIRREISAKASGSFQWVELAIEKTLSFRRKGKSVKTILNMLLQIPQALDGLYRQILINIDKEERSEALHLMQWVCLAARPLALTELRLAMASDWADPRQRPHQNHGELEKSEDYENDAQMKRLVENLSGGLVEVKSEKREEPECTVQLIHQSVYDFLVLGGIQILNESKDIRHSIGQGHHRMARACINYATLADVHLAVRTGQTQQFPFLSYAVKSWVWHAKKAEASGISQDDLPERFQGPFGGFLQRWIDAYRAIDPSSEGCPDGRATLLHVTSEHGILSVVKTLLLEPALDINSFNNKKRTPLSYAAEKGHGEVVKALLDAGANANLKDINGRTPLWYATRNKNAGVLELLLKSDSTKYDIRRWLWYAARNGYEDVIRVLLEKGVDPNSKDSAERTLLWHAAGKGHMGLVTFLLEKGAVVDSRDTWGQTPVFSATNNGHYEVVDLLLRQKADVKSSDKEGRTPLSLAADNGHATLVTLLLAENVDVDLSDEKGRAPLWYAAHNGHARVVEILLENGAGKKA